jgi:hypothetical protein
MAASVKNRSASSSPPLAAVTCFLDCSSAASFRLAEVDDVVATRSLAAFSRSSVRSAKSAGVRICHQYSL